MDNPELKLSKKDYALRITKGAIGAVPFVGGLLGELLDIAVYPKQQEKLNEWFEFVDTTLNLLIEQKNKTKEEIFEDEEFISIFQKTSRIYTNNVEEHKKPILQAYLKASVNKTIPLDKKYIFLRIIDELTETQLLILRDIYDNEKSDNYIYQKQLEIKLVEKFANNDRNYLKLLIKGLQDFHLLNYVSADIVVDNENQHHMLTSTIGKDFFEYLTQE
jgi:hypothetical protein